MFSRPFRATSASPPSKPDSTGSMQRILDGTLTPFAPTALPATGCEPRQHHADVAGEIVGRPVKVSVQARDGDELQAAQVRVALSRLWP